MSLKFVLPGPLRPIAGERKDVSIDGSPSSISDALSLLWRECPGVRDRVMTETGEVRQHVNIFIDGENIRFLEGLSTPVHDGAEIYIFPALSGG